MFLPLVASVCFGLQLANGHNKDSALPLHDLLYVAPGAAGNITLSGTFRVGTDVAGKVNKADFQCYTVNAKDRGVFNPTDPWTKVASIDTLEERPANNQPTDIKDEGRVVNFKITFAAAAVDKLMVAFFARGDAKEVDVSRNEYSMVAGEPKPMDQKDLDAQHLLNFIRWLEVHPNKINNHRRRVLERVGTPPVYSIEAAHIVDFLRRTPSLLLDSLDSDTVVPIDLHRPWMTLRARDAKEFFYNNKDGTDVDLTYAYWSKYHFNMVDADQVIGTAGPSWKNTKGNIDFEKPRVAGRKFKVAWDNSAATGTHGGHETESLNVFGQGRSTAMDPDGASNISIYEWSATVRNVK